MDRLSVLLMRFGFSTETFFQGSFCGENMLPVDPGTGHLHLVKAGQVTFHHERAPPLLVAQPSLVWYPRAVTHRLEASHEAQLLCAIIRPHGTHGDWVQTLPPVIVFPFAQLTSLAPTLDLLIAESSQPGFSQKFILDRLCDVLLAQLLRHLVEHQIMTAPGFYGLSDSALSKAIMAIHAQPGAPWTVEALAGLCSMSRSKFAQRFHSLTGVTPAQYLLEQRMNLAKQLLLHGRQVQDVAHQVGYSTQPAFTRAFRAVCKMSPRDWLNGAQDA